MKALKFILSLTYYMILWPFVSIKVHWTRYDQAPHKSPKKLFFKKMINESEGGFNKRFQARAEVLKNNDFTKDEIREINESDYKGYINWKELNKR